MGRHAGDITVAFFQTIDPIANFSVVNGQLFELFISSCPSLVHDLVFAFPPPLSAPEILSFRKHICKLVNLDF